MPFSTLLRYIILSQSQKASDSLISFFFCQVPADLLFSCPAKCGLPLPLFLSTAPPDLRVSSPSWFFSVFHRLLFLLLLFSMGGSWNWPWPSLFPHPNDDTPNPHGFPCGPLAGKHPNLAMLSLQLPRPLNPEWPLVLICWYSPSWCLSFQLNY